MTENIEEKNGKNLLRDRSPVQRRHAPTYLLITLLSFAFSVTATRIFLNLTGFPKIGNGDLHIAHVLWGGLFLFVASLLPLIFVNQWALDFSALFAGIGVGLFIDEVGKFITSTNNYFFPSAAPIIYAFFLLTVLVYEQVRQQRKRTSREEMYSILEDFAEVLDRDLSEIERKQMISQLEAIIEKNEYPELVKLAKNLKAVLWRKQNILVPHEPDLIEHIQAVWSKFESHWFTRARMRTTIIIGLLLWAAWATTSQVIMYLATHNTQQVQILLNQFMANNLIRNASGMNWFEAQIILEGFMGIFSLVAVFFFIFKKETIATWIGSLDLVITLVFVNLITFYFDQFSTIAFAAVQFLLLVILLMYRRKYIKIKIEK